MKASLIERIEAWREDDQQGYDTAIELLCEAEEALRAKAIDTDTTNAIQDWLKYGMDTFNRIGGHQGYFSPGGFAFDRLRAHFDRLRGVV